MVRKSTYSAYVEQFTAAKVGLRLNGIRSTKLHSSSCKLHDTVRRSATKVNRILSIHRRSKSASTDRTETWPHIPSQPNPVSIATQNSCTTLTSRTAPLNTPIRHLGKVCTRRRSMESFWNSDGCDGPPASMRPSEAANRRHRGR